MSNITNNEWEEKKSADEFMSLVIVVREWFQKEELEVSDFVLGRFASRLQELLSSERQRLRAEIKTKSDNKEHQTNKRYLGYEEAIDDVSKLLE